MNKKIASEIAIGIILLIAIIIGGIVWLQNRTQVPVAKPVVQTQLVTNGTTDKRIIYTNKDYGFQIKLPADWVGYKTDGLTFKLPTTDKNWKEPNENGKDVYDGYGTVFTIIPHDLADYNKMKIDCGTPVGPKWERYTCYSDDEIIGKNNETAFTLMFPTSGPDAEGDSHFGDLHAEIGDPDYFKNNFSIIQLTADETANWQTYTNAKYGFTFKYPKDHTAFSDIDSKEGKFIAANPDSASVSVAEDESLVFCCGGSGITVTAINENVSPSDWFENNSNRYIATSENIKSREVVAFDGKPAYKITGDVDVSPGIYYLVIVVKTENGLIEITQIAKSDLLDKILSTFKFTDSAADENTIVKKGWLEGTVDNWILAETTAQLSGYSGKKFNLKISDSILCEVFLDNGSSNSFKCNDENPVSKFGYGDTVRVYGNINGDNMEVSKMEIVSGSTNNW